MTQRERLRAFLRQAFRAGGVPALGILQTAYVLTAWLIDQWATEPEGSA